MKKLSVIAILSVLVTPAFATDAELAEEKISTTDAETVEVADAEPVALNTDTTNPDIKFPHGLQIGVGVSATSGLNGFVGYANKNFDSFWWKRFGVRLDFATTAPINSLIDSGIDAVMGDGMELGDGIMITDGAIDAYHVAALIDFYPFGDTWFLGGWRISGGYYFGNMDISAKLTGEEIGDFSFSLDGKEYKYKGGEMNATAGLDWSYHGPYLGTGFDLGLFAGFKIYFDAGVVFTNRAPSIALDIPPTGLQVYEGNAWQDVDVGELESAKTQALAEAQEELNKLTFYPMVKIGFMYRF